MLHLQVKLLPYLAQSILCQAPLLLATRLHFLPQRIHRSLEIITGTTRLRSYTLALGLVILSSPSPSP